MAVLLVMPLGDDQKQKGKKQEKEVGRLRERERKSKYSLMESRVQERQLADCLSLEMHNILTIR